MHLPECRIALYRFVVATATRSLIYLAHVKAQSEEFNYTICGEARKLVVKETILRQLVYLYDKLRLIECLCRTEMQRFGMTLMWPPMM